VAEVLAAVQAQLRDWPDHPILSQLAAICTRMLAFPATVPLKQALTGVELLLARAQLWEETAAKHVSIQVREGGGARRRPPSPPHGPGLLAATGGRGGSLRPQAQGAATTPNLQPQAPSACRPSAAPGGQGRPAPPFSQQSR
jgi:hypothetical protein